VLTGAALRGTSDRRVRHVQHGRPRQSHPARPRTGPADRRLLRTVLLKAQDNPDRLDELARGQRALSRQLQSVVNELAGMRRDMDTDRDERRRASKRSDLLALIAILLGILALGGGSDPAPPPRSPPITQVYSPPASTAPTHVIVLPRCAGHSADRIGTTSAVRERPEVQTVLWGSDAARRDSARRSRSSSRCSSASCRR